MSVIVTDEQREEKAMITRLVEEMWRDSKKIIWFSLKQYKPSYCYDLIPHAIWKANIPNSYPYGNFKWGKKQTDTGEYIYYIRRVTEEYNRTKGLQYAR